MLETVYNILKVTVIIAVCTVFMGAITALINILSAVMLTSVVGEVISIISCCLPFSATAVFTPIAVGITGILTFLVAKKIFELTSWGVSAT